MNYYIHHSLSAHVGNIEYFRVCSPIFTQIPKTQGCLCVRGKEGLIFVLEPIFDEIIKFVCFLKVVGKFLW